MNNEWIRWLARQPEEERGEILRGLPEQTQAQAAQELEEFLAQQNAPAADVVEEVPPRRHTAPRRRSTRPAMAFLILIAGAALLLTYGSGSQAAPNARAPQQTQTAPSGQTGQDATAQTSAFSWATIETRVQSDVGLVTGCDSEGFLGCSQDMNGTAWIVDAGNSSNTYLITANHVVSGDVAGTITVHLPQAGVVTAKVIAQDSADDVAEIEVTGLPSNGGLDPAGAWASCGTDTATTGQAVAEVGYPRGDYQLAMTTGQVTSVNASALITGIGVLTEDGFNAANIPGESGGPVLNQQGCVIGIADATSANDANVADFLPITDIHGLGINW